MINTIHITNTTKTTHTIIYIYKCVLFPTYICVLTKQKEEPKMMIMTATAVTTTCNVGSCLTNSSLFSIAIAHHPLAHP